MHPPIEPYQRGWLDVVDGQSLYWECSGNPHGVPAVYVHGGPGSGSSPSARRYFDPRDYRVVLFDQRGCGQSRPLVTSKADLAVNTTAHLLADMEALREHLAIERWVMLGTSWGSTLALAYAQRFTEHVIALVLGPVTTTSRGEVEWITEGVRDFFPGEWARFASHIPKRLRGERLVDAYAQLLFDKDPAVCDAAAEAWCSWETAHVSNSSQRAMNGRLGAAAFRLRFARLVTHYWSNAAFLEDESLIREASRLDGLLGVLVHGRNDISSPQIVAERLNAAWNTSELVIVDDGHGGPAMREAICAAVAKGTTAVSS